MHTKFRRSQYLLIVLMVLFAIQRTCSQDPPDWIDQYNVKWDSQSKNSSESMPVGGGDIGCNVWVENGDIMFYMSRSGTFDENNGFLKSGRMRIRLFPNPFEDGASFSQTLILKDGYIEITGEADGKPVSVDIK